MLTIQQLNNLRDAATYAGQCEQATGVPAELSIAQWALESGWGAHTPGNNCFGIKEYPQCTGKQLLHTREYFKVEEAQQWLASKPGRTAKLEDATKDAIGRQRYACEDWFAAFPTLGHCFIKRATLFHSFRYLTHFSRYSEDRNLVRFVQGIAPIYASDPDYANHVLQIASMPEVIAAVKAVRG